VLLYAIKAQSRTIRLPVSQPAAAGKGSDVSELLSCAVRFGDLAVTTLPWASRSFNPALPTYPVVYAYV